MTCFSFKMGERVCHILRFALLTMCAYFARLVYPRRFVLILDLIKGGEVFDYLIDNGAYSEMEAARLIREVASAISYLHGLGIVHADLKPENLMLSSKNKDEASIKVVDFGCAEILPELWTEGPPLDAGDGSAEDAVQQALLQPRRLIRPGRAGGTTSAYCPPEAFSNEEGAEISQAMDMWSLGVILYIMLTGLHPFDLDSTKTDEEIEDHIKTCRAPPLRGSPYTAHLSPSAIDLLSKLMAEDAKDRLTANEMLAHPWVRGVTARRDVMEASAEKLSKLRRFRSKFEAKVFANLINWSDDDRRHQYDHTTSLVQKAFMSVDEDRKGFVTENDVAKFLGHSVTDQEDAKSAEDASGKAMNLSGFSDMLSENMQSKFFPRGHTVFQEGDPGDYMYFINSGTVEVSTREGFRAKLGQGDSFGEGSLLRPDSRRSATIRCTTPVHAIAVDKVYFDRYMSQGDTLMALKLREKTNTRSFGRVEFVLSQQEGLEKREYDQGDIIFNIGDEADDLYVVDRGTVHIRGPKGNRLYAMNDGDLFGVQSVIMDRNRKASATCASEAGCSLRRMDYHQMNALLRQSPDLKRACHRMAFRREFRRAIVLRTRKSFPRASDLRRVFDSIDRDSSGDLDVDEVKELMKDLDKALSQEQIQELVKSMDLNGSGSINFEEFQSIFGRSVDK